MEVSGAYAEAMDDKIHEMLDWQEQKLNMVGLTCAPRVLGPHCQLPWHCGWPMEHYPCATPVDLGGFVWTCRKCGSSEVQT